MDLAWTDVPIGIDAHRSVGRGGCRTLTAAHTVVNYPHLPDIVDLIESDGRVQIVFTVTPDVFNRA